VGFGVTANQLSLGCDCLGHIKYFDGYRTDSKGNPVHLENVICVHEQDAGLQHKHTNYRSGAATVVRNRQLVVQMICTVSNYEYIFAYIFDQAAGIELEVRATGILSTAPLDNEEGQTVPWGTNVGPGVVAAFHQHMFSYRIDPAIDGFNNTIYYEDSVPMPESAENQYGCGYVTEPTTMKTSGSANTSVERHRVFKIRNDSVINPITYKPVAYKLQTSPSQMLLMGPKSFNYRRAEFASKPIWVTKYNEDELYAAGEFTNQSRKSEGVETWVARNDSIENEDVVLWHSMFFFFAPSFLKPQHSVFLLILSFFCHSLRTHSQPSHRGLPRHARGARERASQARRFLHQEPGPRRPAFCTGFQPVDPASEYHGRNNQGMLQR
jgi:primary-amine oxidase